VARLVRLAGTDCCARLGLRWQALAADGRLFPALDSDLMLTPTTPPGDIRDQHRAACRFVIREVTGLSLVRRARLTGSLRPGR
jgi:hypothetical protein